MAFHCLRLPSSTSSCCNSSSAAPILSADNRPSSSSPSPVCFLSRGGGDGVRSLSSSSSSSSSSASFIKVGRSSTRRRMVSLSVRAGIRAVETYDASFQLQPEVWLTTHSRHIVAPDILDLFSFRLEIFNLCCYQGNFLCWFQSLPPANWAYLVLFVVVL